ncbi:type IX secretion system membrane protein PorP/SprF [Mucilaginibacter sp. UR6-11]|uniref:PorP/SprF family type IX secretion system membrane protein n=1 Tax=Mucilaginibacter sp. UR6-11 TaxID=1435644 RepID=UPI001E60B18B|nr:type IX secretion system membrane protein PorP/SprF [Mucilaginibacter sp. UR6-11]MCC8423438.1 type IX secretion system membrane protein PorP/SprF [Mucilaginibacter sp. UR6-11]
MRRAIYLLLVFFAFSTQVAMAQQLPQYTQYVFNNFLLNPAVAGIENYTDAKLGYRSQWTGLSGAPVTSFLSVNAPIGTNFLEGDASAFPGGGEINPSSRLYTQNYRASEPHHGIGFTLVTDKAGPITQTNVAANYAYHIGLAPRLNLSVGVAAGLNHISLNTSEITLATALDPAIANGNNSQWKPDLGVGAWLYSGDYYVGVSVQQLLKQNLYFSTSTTTVDVSKTVPHYFFTAGTKLYVSDDITLLPSVLIKEIQPVPLTYDINLKASFQDKFWLGGSYRHNDSFGILAGFNLSSFINVGYSYDITTSSLNTVSNGTHEIIIGLLLNNKYKVTCPQHGF